MRMAPQAVLQAVGPMAATTGAPGTFSGPFGQLPTKFGHSNALQFCALNITYMPIASVSVAQQPEVPAGPNPLVHYMHSNYKS